MNPEQQTQFDALLAALAGNAAGGMASPLAAAPSAAMTGALAPLMTGAVSPMQAAAQAVPPDAGNRDAMLAGIAGQLAPLGAAIGGIVDPRERAPVAFSRLSDARTKAQVTDDSARVDAFLRALGG